jgi:hypothetical protein
MIQILKNKGSKGHKIALRQKLHKPEVSLANLQETLFV